MSGHSTVIRGRIRDHEVDDVLVLGMGGLQRLRSDDDHVLLGRDRQPHPCPEHPPPAAGHPTAVKSP